MPAWSGECEKNRVVPEISATGAVVGVVALEDVELTAGAVVGAEVVATADEAVVLESVASLPPQAASAVTIVSSSTPSTMAAKSPLRPFMFSP
jgi:hypothetical protein